MPRIFSLLWEQELLRPVTGGASGRARSREVGRNDLAKSPHAAMVWSPAEVAPTSQFREAKYDASSNPMGITPAQQRKRRAGYPLRTGCTVVAIGRIVGRRADRRGGCGLGYFQQLWRRQ